MDDRIGTNEGIGTDDGIEIATSVASDEIATDVEEVALGFVKVGTDVKVGTAVLMVAAGVVTVAWVLLGRLTVEVPEEV